MKKIISFLIIMLSILLITGCESKVNNNGKTYQIISLKDGNVDVFKSIIPKGWNYNIESRWDVVSSVTPGKEVITLSSPDLSATIKIISQESFVENKKYKEGQK